ncbi:MAG: hypothetical protein JWL63_2228 [Rhodocyclales bacterium]|nr:hypothetical protein [Rhodocyclales bacterium]
MSVPADIDFQHIFRSAPGLLLLLRPDADFTIVEASDAYLRATLTQREQIIGRPLFEVFPVNPDDPDANGIANARASFERVIATRTADTMAVQKYDIRRPASEGGGFVERYWSSVNGPVLSADGELAYIINHVEDATELVRMKHSEQEERSKLAAANRRLAESNNHFQAVYDQGLFAGRLDLNGIVMDANRSSLEQCGYVPEDVIGKPFWECGWWNRSATVQAWLRDGVERSIRGEAFRGESTYFLADGSERVVDFACMPIKNEDSQVLFVVPTGMDITERVQVGRNLRATEILESITEGFFSLDRAWRFTYLNREAENILDRTRSDLLGKSIWDEYQIANTPFEHAYLSAMNAGEASSMTAHFQQHDRWYTVHTYPSSEGIAVYFRNVTAQRHADEERDRIVAESETQRRIYEATLSSTPDFVYVFGLNHRCAYANEALIKTWGLGDPRGKSWLELGYEPWHAEMHDDEIDQVINTRAPIRGEIPFTGTNGRRVYDYIFVPVFGAHGEVVAVAGTTRDITDRQQAEQAIREQAERLAEADRAKDEFLATLAHELRNPLAPLRNSLSVLRLTRDRNNAADGTLTPVHEMMERQVNHLVRLVDDLLEMSRISRGTLALRKERVEVAAIVRNAVETSEPLIQTAGHKLSVSLPQEPLWLEGDAVRLAQILANLLDNAAKYTEDGGQIMVSAQRSNDEVIITVRDNGSGIAPDMLPRLFEMFSRGDHASSRGQGGLGIGLSLARRLATMHGGRLEAHSDGPDQGSEFSVRLPLATTHAADATKPEEPAAAISRKRILVVDDNRDAAESLGLLLGLLGVDVRIAHDGPAALALFEAYDPEVILLDIGMPGMDGYEVTRTIRANFPDRSTFIVALTGWGQEEDRRRAREAGFDHHLIKPTEFAALQMLLASIEDARGKPSDST